MLLAPEIIEAMTPQVIALALTFLEAQVTVARVCQTNCVSDVFTVPPTAVGRLLVERVIVTPTNLELRLRPGGIGSLAADARQVAEAVA